MMARFFTIKIEDDIPWNRVYRCRSFLKILKSTAAVLTFFLFFTFFLIIKDSTNGSVKRFHESKEMKGKFQQSVNLIDYLISKSINPVSTPLNIIEYMNIRTNIQLQTSLDIIGGPKFKLVNCKNPPCFIIHQSWHDYNVPFMALPFMKSCLMKNNDYEYWFWTDEDNRKLIEIAFPELVDVYKTFGLNILRADTMRLIILYTFGGLYMDIDVECMRPLKPLLDKSNCTFAQEPWRQILPQGIATPLVSNFFISCIKGHEFLFEAIKKISRVSLEQPTGGKVMDVTGPFMISDLYRHHKSKNSVFLPEIHNHTVFGKEQNHKKMKDFCLDERKVASAMKINSISALEMQYECSIHLGFKDYSKDIIYVNHHYLNSWVPHAKRVNHTQNLLTFTKELFFS